MQEFTDEMKALLIAGLFGSIVRVLLSPEESWKGRAVRIFIGATSAVFLGEYLGAMMSKGMGVDLITSYSASGFLIGTASEQVIKFFQTRFNK